MHLARVASGKPVSDLDKLVRTRWRADALDRLRSIRIDKNGKGNGLAGLCQRKCWQKGKTEDQRPDEREGKPERC